MYNRTRESGIQGRPQGLSKLEDSLDYMLSCLKKKKCEKGKKQKQKRKKILGRTWCFGISENGSRPKPLLRKPVLQNDLGR